MGRSIRAVGLALSVAGLLAAGPAGASATSHTGHRAASAAAAPGACPTVMAESDVAAGQVGTGWTVEEGQTREAFKVKILGVLPDGIAPGLDLIVIKVSDKTGNDMIARAGGIWAGMSGSPVYIGGKLVGAVSYGLTGSPSPVGGMTPAEPWSASSAIRPLPARRRLARTPAPSSCPRRSQTAPPRRATSPPSAPPACHGSWCRWPSPACRRPAAPASRIGSRRPVWTCWSRRARPSRPLRQHLFRHAAGGRELRRTAVLR